ncbi:MAG: NfeD family protein [Thermoleophilia bacterium]
MQRRILDVDGESRGRTRRRTGSHRRSRPPVTVRRRRLALGGAALLAGMLLLVLGGIFSSGGGVQAAGGGPTVRVINIDGVIDPLVADYVTRNIEAAGQDGSRAIVLMLDTPGGFDTPMRDIIKRMTASPLPVIAFVSPDGARAASAGTFIVMAADLAVMSPGTNLGAAHPVQFGVDAGSTEGVKATNDAAAYIRSLAEAGGRNANWAELAVRQSVSLSADAALQQQVIDMQADSLDALLQQANGFHTRAKNLTIDTRDATPSTASMSLKEDFLRLLLNPNIAYFLFLFGLLALAYEFVHPGIGIGAISGIISLLLSFYAMRILPVNFTGLALVVLGIVLLALDLYVTSLGALSAGGVIALIFGSLLLFDAPFLQVSLPLNLVLAAVTAAFFLIVARAVMKARRLPAQTGQQAMVGEVGHSRSRLDPLGQVFVHGEIWSAEAPADEVIEKGEEIEVVAVSGLMLKVKRTT